MLNDSTVEQIYLACGSTDMRKSIDGLAAIVQEAFELDPFSSAWFVFCNRTCDKLKLLRWEHNGFWLYYRRLERGRFQWPVSGQGETLMSGGVWNSKRRLTYCAPARSFQWNFCDHSAN